MSRPFPGRRSNREPDNVEGLTGYLYLKAAAVLFKAAVFRQMQSSSRPWAGAALHPGRDKKFMPRRGESPLSARSDPQTAPDLSARPAREAFPIPLMSALLQFFSVYGIMSDMNTRKVRRWQTDPLTEDRPRRDGMCPTGNCSSYWPFTWRCLPPLCPSLHSLITMVCSGLIHRCFRQLFPADQLHCGWDRMIRLLRQIQNPLPEGGAACAGSF